MKTNYENLMLINLAMFDGNTNVTGDSGLSDAMKTFYSDSLIDEVAPKLVHAQFGQKTSIPKNSGKRIEWRKYNALPKALTPLTEGVTPDGQKMSLQVVTADPRQYGGYIELSDMLQLTAIDNGLVQATKLLGSQAGRTLDTVVREVLVGGTNLRYANGKVSRAALAEGDLLTVDTVKKAVRDLKKMNAEKISGYYIGIINQDASYDLTNDPEWKYPHQYVDTKNIYEGEIGAIAGVRFVETSEAKKFYAPDLVLTKSDSTGSREITVASVSNNTITIDEKLNAEQASELSGRRVIIEDELYTVTAATAGAAGSASITLAETPAVDITDGDIIYPGEAGADGRDVYATLIIGDNAYGVTDIAGGGLEHIVKQLGSAGTADPLNQRATAGWKATHGAAILSDEYMVRVESVSTFNDGEAN